MNLAAGSSELSAEDIIDAGNAFQSLMVSGRNCTRKCQFLHMVLEMPLDDDSYCAYFGLGGGGGGGVGGGGGEGAGSNFLYMA